MLTINLEYDPLAAAAPQSFRNGLQAAANILQAAIATPITVNIMVGYGEIDLGGPAYSPLVSNFSEGGITSVVRVSYPALRNALAAVDTTPTGVQAIGALPNTLSLGGVTTFGIAPALAKALAFIPANGTAIDGQIGFPTSFTGNGLLGTAIVEELHASGLLNYGGDLGLFSYSSPGVHFLPVGPTSSTPAYFSTDGGNTDLANYSVGLDDTLFAGAPNDPLDIPNQGTVLTPLDLTEIGLIGYTIAAPAAPAAPANPVTAGPGPYDPGNIALNAAAIYGFANTGVPSFTALVNQDGSTDLGLGASLLTGTFIGGYAAGIEVRVMANLEQGGGSTAAIDAQFAHDLDTISNLLTAGNAAEGFGFLSGLTTGGPAGLAGGTTPPGLQADIRSALGTDQQATAALAGCIVGAVNFTQGYVNAVGAGLSPTAALRSVEATALK